MSRVHEDRLKASRGYDLTSSFCHTMSSVDLKDELTCPICLQLYTDPVTLQCGHNFCQKCMEATLDTQEPSVSNSCPQCRAKFHIRPVLKRNTTLCNIAEHFLSQEELEECKIYCTSCDTPVVALKTCLLCKVSLCELHLEGHSKSPEHALIKPTNSLKIGRCSVHKKDIVYYCAEDAECLCVSCCLGEKHRGHKVGLLNEAFKQEKEKLRIIREHIIKERGELETRVQYLQDHVNCLPRKVAGVTERVSTHFRNLTMKQDTLKNQVMKEITKQKGQVSVSVSKLIQQLKSKKDSLSSKISTIDERCQMMGPLLFLQADREVFAEAMSDNNNNLKMTEPDDLAEDVISQALSSGIVKIMSSLQKGYYVQEASGILLDVNTASNDVFISDDLKTASWSEVNLGRPLTRERFVIRRVLSVKGFSDGRLYWDVEVSKEGGWRVGMTYASIGRKGKYSLIGNNKSSWGLRGINKLYSVRHDRKEIPLVYRPTCYKVRIYLDYMAGQLSFYELDDSMRHLYTYNATFTEALYPVIVVWSNAWVRVLS
ncbi:nuclear factor 7, brain-like isoform X1 [Bufo bufo]|uniref:nuclear factor 7, brain-like isoform X1 n=2 Tax=Bufo bufo TaxID=8384 RepID=UPI001ABE67B8|nr:nuclear factor 7, brain-like isoform X1 [Bufo bufo]